jgi:hypothetical protein
MKPLNAALTDLRGALKGGNEFLVSRSSFDDFVWVPALASSNDEREIPERHERGAAVLVDEGVLIPEASTPELDFCARLAGDQNPRYVLPPRSIECRPRRFPTVRVAVQQRPIEIREINIHL